MGIKIFTNLSLSHQIYVLLYSREVVFVTTYKLGQYGSNQLLNFKHSFHCPIFLLFSYTKRQTSPPHFLFKITLSTPGFINCVINENNLFAATQSFCKICSIPTQRAHS